MSKRKPTRSAREMRKELRAIYEDAQGKLPDLSTLSKNSSSGTTRFLWKVIGVLFILSIVTWSGFFLFTQGLFNGGENLSISIEGPDVLKSGEPVSYTIRYENTGGVPIANLQMKLNMPTSFHVLSTVPESNEQQQWTLGSLSENSDGAVTVSGMFLSEVPSSQRVQTLFTYKPANFNSEFQDIETKTIKIEESVVTLSMIGPEKSLSGNEVEYTMNIQHTGEVDVFNLRLLPLFPQDFRLIESKPKLNELGFWPIDLLKTGELKEILIKGAFTSSASGEQNVGARLAFAKEDELLEQAREEVITDVLGGAVSFHLIINGSDKDQNIAAGKTLRGSIDFENKSAQTAEGITFTLELSSQDGSVPVVVDEDLLGGGSYENGRVVWKTPELEKLEPGDSGVIDFSLPLVDELSNKHADAFTLNLQANINRVGSIQNNARIQATPITIQINANARVDAEARYFTEDGEPLGIGPLPPQLNQKTSYRVYFSVSNTLHDLKNVELATILPQDVQFLERTDADRGDVSFNATTRQVRWTINNLSADAGPSGAWFDVAITPGEQDLGNFFKLTNAVTFSARDTITGDELNRSLSELTTDLTTDTFGKDKGVVVE